MGQTYELVAAPTPAANAPTVLTFPAINGVRHVLFDFFAGFKSTPSGTPQLTVEDGPGNVVRVYSVSGKGDTFDFGDGLRFSPGRAVILTLSAGGPGVTGVLSAKHSSV